MKIFRVGNHTGSGGQFAFTADDLQAIADNYDQGKSPAPLVIGHPTADTPSFGEVSKLLFDRASGILSAEFNPVVQGFSDFARQAYRSVSVKLYPKDSPYNPTPGQYYLQHVGVTSFPAVSGLGRPQFSDDNKDSLYFSEAFPMTDETVTIPTPVIEDKPAVITPEFSQVLKQAEDLRVREQALAAREKELAEKENLAFCQQLQSTGVQFDLKIATELMGLATSPKVEFSQGVQPEFLALVQALLTSIPKAVEFSEVAPSSSAVVPNSLTPKAIAEKITKYRREQQDQGNQISFSQASQFIQSHPEY